MVKNIIGNRIQKLTLDICEEQGVELYDIELKNTNQGTVLRIYITTPDGVTLKDCSSVSRKLNNELEISELISSRYFLEVSSPGLERSLKKRNHYEQAIGEFVKVTYREDDNKANTITDILQDVTQDGILVGDKKLLHSSIKKAKTVFNMSHKSR